MTIKFFIWTWAEFSDSAQQKQLNILDDSSNQKTVILRVSFTVPMNFDPILWLWRSSASRDKKMTHLWSISDRVKFSTQEADLQTQNSYRRWITFLRRSNLSMMWLPRIDWIDLW